MPELHPEKFTLHCELVFEGSWPSSVAFLGSGRRLAAGNRDWVRCLGLSRDQKRLITGDDSGLVCVWDLPARKEIARWTGSPGNWVTSACLSPDAQTAFVGEFTHPRGSFDRPPAQVRLF